MKNQTKQTQKKIFKVEIVLIGLVKKIFLLLLLVRSLLQKKIKNLVLVKMSDPVLREILRGHL